MSAQPKPNEPSMEEILASIRKIIATENPPAQPAEEILELTDVVDDEPAPVPEPEPEPEPVPEPVVEAVEEEQPPPEPEPEPVEEPVMQDPTPEPEPETIVSPDAGDSAAAAFAALADHLDHQVEAPEPGLAMGNGGQTLEGLVSALMRPMLKEWLDSNLPAIVERLVKDEIERIARRKG